MIDKGRDLFVQPTQFGDPVDQLPRWLGDNMVPIINKHHLCNLFGFTLRCGINDLFKLDVCTIDATKQE